MRIVPYSNEMRDAWDAFCGTSKDAWFWHTRDWFDYASAVLGNAVIADVSFAVFDGNSIIAIAPAMAIEGFNGQSARLGLGDQPIPWPALLFDRQDARRKHVEDLVFAAYTSSARSHRLGRVEMFGVVLAESFYKARFPPANIPLVHGHRGEVFNTQVIDLSISEERLWHDMRKGHRAAVTASKRSLEIRVWCDEISDTEFDAYRQLHALAAGRVTRAERTFDAMRDWIRKGCGLLVGANLNGQWVGFAYFMLYKSAAFYASACNHPDAAVQQPVGHPLIWNAILACRQRGITLLEMGMQTYDHPGADRKLVSISLFKRGFGGLPMPRMQSSLSIL